MDRHPLTLLPATLGLVFGGVMVLLVVFSVFLTLPAGALLPATSTPTAPIAITPRPTVPSAPTRTSVPTPSPRVLTPTPAPPTPTPVTYSVRPGDTLANIATRYGIGLQDLMRANGITDPDRVSVGQTLLIPRPPTPTPSASSGPAATAQPAQTPSPEPTSAAPSDVQEYTVQLGDTLVAIADRFGVKATAIVGANPGLNSERLFPGQKLLIPLDARQEPPTYRNYIVEAGDSLRLIAEKFGISVADILRANPSVDQDRIFPGQELSIPLR